RWMLAAAAIVIVAAGVSWHALRSARQSAAPAPAERVATTGAGEHLTIRLDDSSIVALGPMSTIRYSASAARRTATISGIADFNVVHDAARPFRVLAKNAVVTDVGTEFVVRAFAADSGVDVSVTSGVVTVSVESVEQPLQLRAGQVAFV